MYIVIFLCKTGWMTWNVYTVGGVALYKAPLITVMPEWMDRVVVGVILNEINKPSAAMEKQADRVG